jgi:LacI family transcriptional regulator, galactose operon repressor
MSRERPIANPTVDDVARHAGVSTATVSRCLNEPTIVREETRQRVMEAVQALGYAPNFGARSLVLNRTNIMGAVIPTMDNAIFARGLQSLEERLADNGVTLLVATSNYSPEKELNHIKTMLARGVDGLMLIGEARDPGAYDLLYQRKMPFVLAWTWKRDCKHLCVGFDNEEAGAMVAREVMGCGHKRLAMIAGITKGNDRAAERLRGVRKASKDAGKPLLPNMVVEAEYTFKAGQVAFLELMRRTPRPTAVICGNDVIAVGALAGAHQLGLRVPADVSVVGFDDIDIARYTRPPLTTVHVPHRRMGLTAANKLLAMRETEKGHASERIEVEFMGRESLGSPPPG